MWGVLKLFDAYTIRARIIPALIAGLPSLSLPFVLVPWDTLGLSNIIVTTMSFILLVAFSDVARRSGRRVEKYLGTRSTPELWHRSNAEIPNVSKDLYRPFIASKLKRVPPTEIEEIEQPSLANDFYEGAGTWLRDETRDTKKFKILFEELLTYGFRRNLLGLKPTSLVMNAVVLLISIAILIYKPSYFDEVINTEEKLAIIIIVYILHSIYMILAVDRNSVQEASQIYGKQLILSCALLMKSSRVPRAKAKKE